VTNSSLYVLRLPLSSSPLKGRVAVHLPSHLTLLSQPAQTTRLQTVLDPFQVPLTSLTLLKLDLGLPPLDLPTQVALARLHCRLQVLPSDHLARQLFLLHTSPTPLPRRCYATRSSCTWPVTRLGRLLPLPCHPPSPPPAQMGLNLLQITPTNNLRYLEATLLHFLAPLPPSTSPLTTDLTPTCPCAQQT